MHKVILIALLLLTAISGSAAAQELPNKDQLGGGWNQLSPGGETTCGHGAPYSFYYREGSGQELLIYFQGGGMCWNAQTCNVSTTTFDDWVDPNSGSDNPAAGAFGIFDFSNPENPFINYDILYVDYCTGDMHTGNAVPGYDYNGTWFDTKHKGAINASAALNWAYNNIPIPDSVFVAGCSAGAVGAAFWGADIANHYSSRSVTLLADSGGGWRGIPADYFNLWGASYPGGLNVQSFFVGAANAGARIAQFNTISDETQSWFTTIGFSGGPYTAALRANLSDISRSVRSFRYFTGDGEMHCILPRQDFYSYSSNAVRIRDWIALLEDGQPVANLICSSCVEQ